MRISIRGSLAAFAFASRTLGSESADAITSSDLVSSTTTNLGDYVAAGLDLEKAEIQTTSSNSYTFSNATSTASLLSQATGGAPSRSTSYANLTSKGISTATRLSTASLLSLNTGEISSNSEPVSTEKSTVSLLSLATGGTSPISNSISNGTTTAILFPLATGGTSALRPFNANGTLSSGNTVTAPLTSYITSCRPSSTDSRGLVWSDCDTEATLVTKTFTNTSWVSATDADQCWTEWDSYWSMHPPAPATISGTTIYLPAVTEIDTQVFSSGSYITDQTITSTILSTAPTEADNGGFATTMSQVVITYVTVLTTSLYTAIPISTSLHTYTRTPEAYNYITISASYDSDWPTPSCTLPTVYSDCQLQWEEYATHNGAVAPPPWSGNCEFDVYNMSQTAPACYIDAQSSFDSWSAYVKSATSPTCSQASITGDLCTSLKDAYVLGWNEGIRPMLPLAGGPTFSSGYYSMMNPAYTGWTWPASQPFAPGCSLDCGRCAVTGGSIQLLYFPPGMTPHPETAQVVATTLGTVLTSPTYYISFESIYASDVCSGVGSTLTSLILPIPTDEPLSTLFGSTMACDAQRQLHPWRKQYVIGTAAMNVSDLLHESVPYSIYTSQPYCATQMIGPSGCIPVSCPTTLPYRPLIVLSSQLLNTLDPAWASCSLDLRGLYDPPKALQPATAIVLPTVAGPSPTTSAIPASGPAGATSDPTALPEQDDPTPIQTPVNPPKPTSPSAEAPNPTPDHPQTVVNPIPEDPPTQIPAPVKAYKTTSNDPPPVTSPRTSADPAGALISLIADLSSGGVSNPAAATNIKTTVSGGIAAQPPPAGDPARPPTEPSDNPADPPSDPAISDGAPVAGGNGDPSQPAIPSGDAGQVVNHDPAVISVGSQLVTATPGQPLVVAGTTIAPNAAVTVDGHTLSSGSVGLIVDGTPVLAPPNSGGQAPAVTFTIGSQTLTASAGDAADPSAVVVAGTTLTPGGSATTINGAVVSAGSAGLVIDGTRTVGLPNGGLGPAGVASQAILTLGSSTVTAVLAAGIGNAIVIDGTTVVPGGSAITVDGTRLSAGTAGLVIAGTQTIPRSAFDPAPTAAAASQAVFTLGSDIITAFVPPGAVATIVVDGTTLSAGGSAITVDGTRLSAGTAGLVIGGTQTIPVADIGSATAAAAGLQTVLTIGSSTITATLPSRSGNTIVVDGTTLSPGGSTITVDGTVLSIGTAGLVVGGTQTIPFASMGSATTSSNALQTVLIIGSSTITATLPFGTGNIIVVDGTTLSPGGSAITVDDTELSAGTAGLVAGGTRTVALTATTGGSQTTDRTVTSSPTTPAATDPGSTSESAQSDGQRPSIAYRGWLCVLMGMWALLLGA